MIERIDPHIPAVRSGSRRARRTQQRDAVPGLRKTEGRHLTDRTIADDANVALVPNGM